MIQPSTVRINLIKILLKNDLASCHSWFDNDGLTVNTEKSCYLASDKITPSVDMLGQNLRCKDTVKYLGLIIEKK